MRTLWTSVLVLTVAGFVGIGSVYANGPKEAPKKEKKEKGEKKEKPKHPPIREIFKKLDTNKNGKICVEEFLKSHKITDREKGKGIFAQIDANKDGGVCPKELAIALKK